VSITFEFSKQESLLKQYYKLREECFRNELGLEAFDGTEDLFDQTGHTLIFRDGDSCIGGVRINGCSLSTLSQMPLEHKGLDIAQMLPQLNLPVAPSCQLERFVLQPEYRNTDMLRAICRAQIRACASLGYHYAFNVTGIKRARLYKRVHSSLSYDYDIFDQVTLPVESGFAHLEHLLSIAFIPDFKRKMLYGADSAQVFAGIWQQRSGQVAA